MRKFYQQVVKHPKLILTSFLAAFVLCFFCQKLIAVDYDMNDYLPEDSPSTIALDVMDAEYTGGIPNARVMIQNVTVSEALEYKEKLLAVDGVTDVTWLDDVASVTQPLEFIPEATRETYYKDGNALFSVTIEDEKILRRAMPSVRSSGMTTIWQVMRSQQQLQRPLPSRKFR